jgi:hypothetical protein
MLGSPPRTSAVSASKRLAQRLHINGNAIYHVGSTAFMAFLDGVEKNKADNSAWQVCVGGGCEVANYCGLGLAKGTTASLAASRSSAGRCLA